MSIPHEGCVPLGTITISADVATLVPGENKIPETLISEADKAPYRAKELGRNRGASYEETAEGRNTGASSASGEASSA
jgi:PleD family two-component response regulator